jgi:hypothetical protein
MDSSNKDVADQKVAIYEGIQPSEPYTPKEYMPTGDSPPGRRSDLISKALPVAKHDPPSNIHLSQ